MNWSQVIKSFTPVNDCEDWEDSEDDDQHQGWPEELSSVLREESLSVGPGPDNTEDGGQAQPLQQLGHSLWNDQNLEGFLSTIFRYNKSIFNTIYMSLLLF